MPSRSRARERCSSARGSAARSTPWPVSYLSHSAFGSLAKPDPPERLGNVRRAAHLAALRIEPEQRPNRKQRRACGPGLRFQRARVLDRRVRPVPRKAREDLRELIAEAFGRAQQRLAEPAGLVAEAVPAHPPGDPRR